MKTKHLIFGSAVLFCFLVVSAGGGAIAIFAVFGFHALVHQIHVLELKINKLLNDKGLYMTPEDYND